MNRPIARIKDIADITGCSTRVVSAVLNPGNSTVRVGEATRQRIEEAARDQGYRPNQLARAVASGKNRVLGVVTENAEIEHKAFMLAGAIEAANIHDYLIKVLPIPHRVVSSQPIEKCIEWRLSGLLAVNLSKEYYDFLRRETAQLGIPLALVDNAGLYDDCISVVSDDDHGVRLALKHLIELGHRDIAFLGGAPDSPASQMRESSFRAVMSEYRLPLHENWILQSDWGGDIVESAALSLIGKAAERPTAVLCAGDPVAMIMIRVARRLSLQVPAQLSVVGFANFYLSLFCDPALTTVEQPFTNMGRVAAERLISIAEAEQEDDTTPLHACLPTRLVRRQSTASPSRLSI